MGESVLLHVPAGRATGGLGGGGARLAGIAHDLGHAGDGGPVGTGAALQDGLHAFHVLGNTIVLATGRVGGGRRWARHDGGSQRLVMY